MKETSFRVWRKFFVRGEGRGRLLLLLKVEEVSADVDELLLV